MRCNRCVKRDRTFSKRVYNVCVRVYACLLACLNVNMYDMKLTFRLVKRMLGRQCVTRISVTYCFAYNANMKFSSRKHNYFIFTFDFKHECAHHTAAFEEWFGNENAMCLMNALEWCFCATDALVKAYNEDGQSDYRSQKFENIFYRVYVK